MRKEMNSETNAKVNTWLETMKKKDPVLNDFYDKVKKLEHQMVQSYQENGKVDLNHSFEVYVKLATEKDAKIRKIEEDNKHFIPGLPENYLKDFFESFSHHLHYPDIQPVAKGGISMLTHKP